MQFVNDDMDDLFRESAENYPLNTGKPGWEQVLQKMQDANVESKTYTQPESKRKYYFTLLLLLPMFLICNHFSDKSIGRTETNEMKSKGTAQTTKTSAAETADRSLTTAAINNENKNEMANTTGLNRKSPENTSLGGTEYPVGFNKEKNSNDFIAKQDRNTNIQAVNKENNYNTDLAEAGFSDNTQNDDAPGVQADKNEENIDEKKPIIQEATQKEDSTVKEQPVEKQLKENKKKEKQLYIGFLVGPDYSMVKSRTTNRAGYSVGLLAGYRFAKNLSIETGILWDRKRYKVEGQHFNKEKMNLLMHSNLLKVWGYCDMFEVPINLRYDFSNKGNHSWFATAGVSSYLMKKEDYGYAYERYGNQYQGWKSYENASSNWLSVANISIGYQRKLGNIGQLRIEPYLKLPLGGVGIGDMRLQSSGVYVGFTRPIR